MGTTLETIVDLYSAQNPDFRANALNQSSGSAAFLTYHEPLLLHSITEFEDICTQDLTYSTTTQSFTETLTQKNQNMLALIMAKYQIQREVQNIMSMTNFLNDDRGFKTYSAANNLKEKRELYILKCEEIDSLLLRYGYANNSWSNWELQDFA